jgi:hypothetical protein
VREREKERERRETERGERETGRERDLVCSPGWPQTHDPQLPKCGITGTQHHTQLSFILFQDQFDYLRSFEIYMILGNKFLYFSQKKEKSFILEYF